MSFAFVTILLLLISLPGYVLRRSYFTSKFSIKYIPTNIINELFWSFFPAIFIHGIAILIIERFVLENYYLSKKNGGLERIIIKYPSKKVFSIEGQTEDRDIPGNYLTISYEKIININIQYYALHEEKINPLK